MVKQRMKMPVQMHLQKKSAMQCNSSQVNNFLWKNSITEWTKQNVIELAFRVYTMKVNKTSPTHKWVRGGISISRQISYNQKWKKHMTWFQISNSIHTILERGGGVIKKTSSFDTRLDTEKFKCTWKFCLIGLRCLNWTFCTINNIMSFYENIDWIVFVNIFILSLTVKGLLV